MAWSPRISDTPATFALFLFLLFSLFIWSPRISHTPATFALRVPGSQWSGFFITHT
jgi:hypothetical protein